jgi:hypothetical protein
MLKSTGVDIELMSDISMILFIEQNIRGEHTDIKIKMKIVKIISLAGGMSYVNQRYCEAGVRRCEKTGEKIHQEIIYIDGMRLNNFFLTNSNFPPSLLSKQLVWESTM